MEAEQNYILRILVPIRSVTPRFRRLKAFALRLAQKHEAEFRYSKREGFGCFEFKSVFEKRFDLDRATGRFYDKLAAVGADFQRTRTEISDNGLLLEDLLRQLSSGFPNRIEIADSYRMEYLEPVEAQKLMRGEVQPHDLVKAAITCVVQPPESINSVASMAASAVPSTISSLENVLYGIRMFYQGIEVACAGPFVDRYGNSALKLGVRVYPQPRTSVQLQSVLA